MKTGELGKNSEGLQNSTQQESILAYDDYYLGANATRLTGVKGYFKRELAGLVLAQLHQGSSTY